MYIFATRINSDAPMHYCKFVQRYEFIRKTNNNWL